MQVVARIHSDFKEKFGIPRQSGLVDELEALVVFEPEYRNPDALRGLEGYSYIWLLWEFSENIRRDWSPTVRPPRLGGNERVGVFATRSPFRPNPIGLSSVRLLAIEEHPIYGKILRVAGADLMDGTPIYDIKPYLPHVDSHPEATAGFTADIKEHQLQVECTSGLLEKIPKEKRQALIGVLENDPRPAYQNDPDRIYGMNFAGCEVKFRVEEGVLHVTDIISEVRFLWGEAYEFIVERSLKRPLTELRGNSIYMRVGAKSTEVEQRKQLDKWYVLQMQEKLREVVPRYEEITGRHASEWRFRRMKTRWGSCNIGRARICLNIQLAEKPIECLEYVVAHELTHLHEIGHNKRFWGLMDEFYPNWKEVRKQMNER